MSWALKRQLILIIIFIFLFAFAGFILIYPYVREAPSCADGKLNGDETEIDCGGSCARACLSKTDDISIMWSRAFEIIPGRYNAVAYIMNHNKNSAIQKINYRFRFGDEKNIYIGKREGSTYIPPGGKFAIFEPGIDVGNSIPVYTTFEFTERPVWLQVPQEKIDQLKVFVTNAELTGENTSPRLTGTVKNNSLFTIPNLSVIAILHEKGGNAIGASRTLLPVLNPLQSADLNFTWPLPLLSPVVEKELIPMFDIFSVKLQ